MRLAAAMLVLALTVTGCGGGQDEGGAEDQAAVTQQTEVVDTGGFGSAVTVGDGVAVTLDNMATFTPGEFATGYVKGDSAVTFDVTVANTSAAEIFASSLSMTAMSGENGCIEIFDGDNGLEGAPGDPIATGASATFKWAISCGPAKAGDPLDIELSFDGATAVKISGSLV